jgi:hypothetical protein
VRDGRCRGRKQNEVRGDRRAIKRKEKDTEKEGRD